jgi:hypothetical protein
VASNDGVRDSGTEAGEAKEKDRGPENISSGKAEKINLGSETGDHDARK